MGRYIEKNHGHWQLKAELKEILLECRAKQDNSRHAIRGICATENALAATDGKRLVEVQCRHEILLGTYYVSEDGYLLETTELRFPKYEDVIPEKDQSQKIVEVGEHHMGENVIGLILGELCHAGCITNLSLYQRPVEILSAIIEGKVRVFVHKESPADRPFLIEAETTIGFIRYAQMPLNVKNEAKEPNKDGYNGFAENDIHKV